jgi:hypothetical protein
MRLRRFAPIVLVMFGILLTACQSTIRTNPGPPPAYSTPGPLSKTAQYWDLGLSINYPSNWADPQFMDGQMIVAESAQAVQSQQAPAGPVVALRILDSRDAQRAKSLTLEQIAFAATGGGKSISVVDGGPTMIGGVDAAYIRVADASVNVRGQIIAFRLPDGRIGTLSAAMPNDLWAYFAPTLDEMRSSIKLLKVTDFSLPTMTANLSLFSEGGITFDLPQNWIDKPLGGNTRLYRDSSTYDYIDDVGYVNGPQLIVVGQPLAKDVVLTTALIDALALKPDDKITGVTVGGHAGVQFSRPDPRSGHISTFVGFPSQDRSVFIVFRWTTPGVLTEALRPTLDKILESVKFSAISATLVPMPTNPSRLPTATPTGSSALPILV